MKLREKAALAMAVTFLASGLCGCGVSQKKYDALLSEKVALEEKCAVLIRAHDALKNEYDNLLKEKMNLSTSLETALNERKALKDEYDKILGEKIAVRAAYDKLVAETQGLKGKLAEALSVESGEKVEKAQ